MIRTSSNLVATDSHRILLPASRTPDPQLTSYAQQAFPGHQASSYLIYDRTIDNSWIYRGRPIGYTRIIEPFSPSVTAWLNPTFGKYRWSPPPSSFFFSFFSPPILFVLVSSSPILLFRPLFSPLPGNMNVPCSHRGHGFGLLFCSVKWPRISFAAIKFNPLCEFFQAD